MKVHEYRLVSHVLAVILKSLVIVLIVVIGLGGVLVVEATVTRRGEFVSCTKDLDDILLCFPSHAERENKKRE